MAKETVRVLQGCVINGRVRKDGDVVRGVERIDALTLSAGTHPLAEIVDEQSNARSKRRPQPGAE